MPDDPTDPENSHRTTPDDVVEATILGALMFSAAACCRSLGITDPADMDKITGRLLGYSPPGTPTEALAQIEEIAASLNLYDQSMTKLDGHSPFSDRKWR